MTAHLLETKLNEDRWNDEFDLILNATFTSVSQPVQIDSEWPRLIEVMGGKTGLLGCKVRINNDYIAVVGNHGVMVFSQFGFTKLYGRWAESDSPLITDRWLQDVVHGLLIGGFPLFGLIDWLDKGFDSGDHSDLMSMTKGVMDTVVNEYRKDYEVAA